MLSFRLRTMEEVYNTSRKDIGATGQDCRSRSWMGEQRKLKAEDEDEDEDEGAGERERKTKMELKKWQSRSARAD